MPRRLSLSVLVFSAVILACSQTARFGSNPAPTSLADLIPSKTHVLGTTENNPDPTVTLNAPIELNWFIGLTVLFGDDRRQPIADFINRFNAEQGGKFHLNARITAADSAVATLQDDLLAGNIPDIVGPTGINQLGKFTGAWLDLSDWIASSHYDLSDYDPALLNVYRSNFEGQISLPFMVFPSALWYNKKLFDQAGLAYPPHDWEGPYEDAPWDFNSLRRIAMRLTLDDQARNALQSGFDPDSTIQFGYQAQWTTLRGQWTFFRPETFVGDAGNAFLPEVWRDAAHWYYDGIWQDHFIPSMEYYGSDSFEGGDVFSSGKLALMPQNLWYTVTVGDVDWDVAAMPAFEGNRPVSRLHADSFAIPKESNNRSAATEVLGLFYGRYAADLMNALVGPTYGFPARRSLQQAAIASYREKFPGVDFGVFLEALKYPDIPSHESGLPNSAAAEEILEAFRANYESDGNLNLDQALDGLIRDLQRVFDEVR